MWDPEKSTFDPIVDGQTRPIVLGILGASRIVNGAILQAELDGYTLYGLAARELNRAQTFTSGTAIPRAFGSYQELLQDPRIDAVYVALPASEHCWASQAALAAKKHVLCEKPLCLALSEAKSMQEVAAQNRRLLMEAHHWRYHPLLAQATTWLQDIGELVRIEASFVGGLNNPSDIRLNPLLGPGVAMDFGCYTIQWASYVAETCGKDPEPVVEQCSMVQGEPEVDLALSATLTFSSISAKLHCDMRDHVPFAASFFACGTKGSLLFENPLSSSNSSIKFLDSDGSVVRQQKAQPTPTTYTGQLRAFRDALITGKPPLTSGETILRTQRALDALYQRAGLMDRLSLRENYLRDL